MTSLMVRGVPAIVGYTGAEQGMTGPQIGVVRDVLTYYQVIRGVHGDCVGGDREFDALCKQYHIPRHAFPGHNQRGESPKRAFCDAQYVAPSKPYLERNIDIVKAATVMVACPAEYQERQRGGVWYTIGHSNPDLPMYVVLPDGSCHPKWDVFAP